MPWGQPGASLELLGTAPPGATMVFFPCMLPLLPLRCMESILLPFTLPRLLLDLSSVTHTDITGHNTKTSCKNNPRKCRAFHGCSGRM
ncbi:hypothetical protein F5X98DRAFT_103714 [Xylaria grammica]|nr:hypothetical protein F5X98DRAFT_103714 [Xylaria grammica]